MEFNVVSVSNSAPSFVTKYVYFGDIDCQFST